MGYMPFVASVDEDWNESIFKDLNQYAKSFIIRNSGEDSEYWMQDNQKIHHLKSPNVVTCTY